MSSVVDLNEVGVDLPRTGVDPFWSMLLEDFAGAQPERLRNLAILALREHSGWDMRTIGRVFHLHKGNVSRRLQKVKAQIRQQFDLDAGALVPRAD